MKIDKISSWWKRKLTGQQLKRQPGGGAPATEMKGRYVSYHVGTGYGHRVRSDRSWDLQDGCYRYWGGNVSVGLGQNRCQAVCQRLVALVGLVMLLGVTSSQGVVNVSITVLTAQTGWFSTVPTFGGSCGSGGQYVTAGTTTSYTLGWNPACAGIAVHATTPCGNSGDQPYPNADGGSMTFYCCGAGPPATVYYWNGCYTNNSQGHVNVTPHFNDGSSHNGSCYDLDPGGVACASYNSTNGAIFGGWTGAGGTCSHPAPPYWIDPPTWGTTNSPGPDRGDPGGSPGAPGSSPPTGWPTNWTGPGGSWATNPATAGDISTLAGIISQGFGQEHSDLGGLGASMLMIINGVTNLVSEVDGNGFQMRQLETNLWNSLVDGDRMLTNLFSAMTNQNAILNSNLFAIGNGTSNLFAGGSSNVLGSGWSNGVAVGGLLAGSYTNGWILDGNSASNAAMAGGGGRMGGFGNGMSNLAGAFNRASNTWGSGSASPLHVVMFGQNLSFDPEDQIPGIWGWIKLAATLSVLIWFAYELGRVLMEADTVVAAVQTGGVPDMATEIAGTGGNILGMAVFATTVLAVTALLYLVVDAFLPSALGNVISQATGAIGSFFSGSAVPEGAVGTGSSSKELMFYLVQQAVPLSLIISCGTTVIGLRLVGGKVLMLVNIACRFLPGK